MTVTYHCFFTLGSKVKVKYTRICFAAWNTTSTCIFDTCASFFVQRLQIFLLSQRSRSYVYEIRLLTSNAGRVAQTETYLATDANLTADPRVASSTLAWSHTFVEIEHEILSMVILLPSAESFKKVCCQ